MQLFVKPINKKFPPPAPNQKQNPATSTIFYKGEEVNAAERKHP
jgi:hypothetical protein